MHLHLNIYIHTSGPCSTFELEMRSTKILNRIRSKCLEQDNVVEGSKVHETVGHLKANKIYRVLKNEFFINGPRVLSVRIVLLITAMLEHGFAPSLLTVSAVIPIAKGHKINLNESANYRDYFEFHYL